MKLYGQYRLKLPFYILWNNAQQNFLVYVYISANMRVLLFNAYTTMKKK